MDGAHLHLMLNHFPLIGLVFSFFLLCLGMYLGNENYVKAGMFIILVSGVLAIPTFLSGEPAEEVLEKCQGFAKKFVEPHEEAAELAIWFVGLTTIAAAIGTWLSFTKKNTYLRSVLKLIVALNLITLVIIARVNNLGGLISHVELRGEGSHMCTSSGGDEHNHK